MHSLAVPFPPTSAMLQSLHLKDFKNHVDSHFDGFGRINVFVGPNGSGKTSVLQALDLMHQLGGPRMPSEVLSGALAPRTLVRQHSVGSVVSGSGTSQSGDSWSVELSFPDDRSDPDGFPSLAFRFGGYDEKELRPFWSISLGAPFSPGHDSAALASGELTAAQIRPAIYLKLDAERIATPTYSEEEVPRAEPTGEGTAVVLADLSARENERKLVIERAVAEVVPMVTGLIPRRKKLERSKSQTVTVSGQTFNYQDRQDVIGYELHVRMASGAEVPAHACSEGTLLVIALMTILHHEGRPNVILLDDIESGLHPRAQIALMGYLESMVETMPALQLFISTHSAYIVDAVPPENVWVIGTNETGEARPRKLSEHPEVERFKGMLSSGELWSTFGEEWAVGNAPAAS